MRWWVGFWTGGAFRDRNVQASNLLQVNVQLHATPEVQNSLERGSTANQQAWKPLQLLYPAAARAHRCIIAQGHGGRLEFDGRGRACGRRRRHAWPQRSPGRRRHRPAGRVCRRGRLLREARRLVSQAGRAVAAAPRRHATSAAAGHWHGGQAAHATAAGGHWSCGVVARDELLRHRGLLRRKRVIGRPGAGGGKGVVGSRAAAAASGGNAGRSHCCRRRRTRRCGWRWRVGLCGGAS